MRPEFPSASIAEDEHSLQAVPAAEFQAALQAHAAWISAFFENVRELPVASKEEPGFLLNSLPSEAPEQGESFDRIFADFQKQIVPGLTHWNHPRFFGYFANSATPPSILADMLAAAVNVNAMLWKTSPAATELEQVTLGWLRRWLAFDDEWFGIIYDTASIGVLQAIGAAREFVAPEVRTNGMRSDLTVYVSEQTHSSSEKAAITLGFGQKQVRKIPVDDAFRMRADVLEETLRADVASGFHPCCIVASVGSTSTSAIDPVDEIAGIAERYGAWLHVDAAYGGAAAVLPEMRSVLRGAERAHSIIINPHKWLYVGVDCSVLYTRLPDVLRRASSLRAEYLRTDEDDQVVNFMDYGVQLGRRFRALKLWYVFRYYGRSGVCELLRMSIQLAQKIQSLVEADPDFELAAPVPLSLVCFRHRSGDAFNRELLSRLNASGQVLLSHTVLRGQYVLRFAIGNFQTTLSDVVDAWNLIRHTATLLAEELA
jgi:aromatic-L-amino-acid/L-tryptophan decarboxylase